LTGKVSRNLTKNQNLHGAPKCQLSFQKTSFESDKHFYKFFSLAVTILSSCLIIMTHFYYKLNYFIFVSYKMFKTIFTSCSLMEIIQLRLMYNRVKKRDIILGI